MPVTDRNCDRETDEKQISDEQRQEEKDNGCLANLQGIYTLRIPHDTEIVDDAYGVCCKLIIPGIGNKNP